MKSILFGNLTLAMMVLTFIATQGCSDSASGSNQLGEACNTDSNCASGLVCHDNVCVDAEVFDDVDPGDVTGDGNDDTTGDGSDDTTGDGSDDSNDDGGDGSGDGVSDGTGDGEEDQTICAEVDVNFDEVVPTVVVLIDQSGSMTEDFSGVERWTAVYDVLMDQQDGLITNLEDRVRFGLALYTGGGNTCPTITSVNPALNNRDAIDTVYAPERPEGDTPTGDAIDAILPMFDNNPTGGPELILLATDGEPDTCEEPNPQNGQGEAVTAAENAFNAGQQTVILSVGSDVSDGHLQDMANAGAGVNQNDPDAPFYKANDSQQLRQQLEQIIGGARVCKFTLEGANIMIPELGTVRVNGTERTHDDPNGWILIDDPSQCFGADQCIELQGQACQDVLDAEMPTVNATFPCDAIEIN